MTGGSSEPLERDLYKVLATDLPQARRLAFGVVLGQAGVTVTAALCAWGFADARAGLSAFLGGGLATGGKLAMFAAFAATLLVYWIALLAALPALGGARRGA